MKHLETFFGWVVAMGIIGLFCCAFAPSGSWYAVKYDVPVSHVIVEPEPHDCDFLHAPIGDKDCHYLEVVQRAGDHVYISRVRETTEEAAERRQAERAAREEIEQAREREFRGQMTQADRDEAARQDAQPEVYSPDAHGNTCLPHQRRENEQHEFVCPSQSSGNTQ
jgi:hypothetical protein